MQLFLQLDSQRWKINLLQGAEKTLRVATSSYSLQWFQKVHAVIAESRSELCSCCKPKKIARQVANRGHLTRCNRPTRSLSGNTIATQVAKKLAPCNTSYRPRFYSLQRLKRFFETITIYRPIYSPTLQHIICLLQLAMDFFFQLNTSFKTE